VKLPIGVALRVSLGWVLSPSEPTCAVTAVPYLRQPPAATFDQACRVAGVLLVECAVTVMTRVALPVLNRWGSACPRGAVAVVVAGRGLADVGGAVDAACGAAVLRGAELVRGAAVVCAGVVVGDEGAPVTVGADAEDDRAAAAVELAGAVAPEAVRIGRNAGRAAGFAVALLCGAVVEALSRAAAFMWSATTAQPATPSDARPAAITRPRLMWSVCQV
jgi:hypothetical protein